jgi:cytosine/adenosine deaminase-related metal-dependent hydrolase
MDDGATQDAADANPPSTHRVVNAVDIEGRPLSFDVRDGRIVAPGSLGDDVDVRDLGGALVVPAFVDAHVHLTYYDVARAHAQGGIALALDLASPERSLTSPPDTSPRAAAIHSSRGDAMATAPSATMRRAVARAQTR